MQPHPLCAYIPRLTYFRHVVKREQFFEYESVQQEWLLFAVEDGSFFYEIGEHRATASYGDLVFCPPHVGFRRIVISPVTLFVLRMVWHDDEGNELEPVALEQLPIGKVSIQATGRLAAEYAAMRRYANLDERWCLIGSKHYLHHLWLLYCEESDQFPTPERQAECADPLVRQAMRLIQARAFEQTSLHSIAAELGVSRVQLWQKFQSELGTTPIKALTALRMEKAKQLLTETNLTIDQISECCGYQNGFYLSRVFKKNCGTSPTKYRQAHRL